MLPPREHSLEFGTIKAYFWRSPKLPPEVSPVFFSKAIVGTVSTSCATPHASSREHVITELSLRPIVDCRVFCNSFDAHAGWLRDRRDARPLNLLFCRFTDIQCRQATGHVGCVRGDKRVRVSEAMRLSRSSHRKRDPAIPNQVGARRPVPPTCVDPRKPKGSPLRYPPWSAPLSSGARAIIPNPPHHVHQRLSCPVRVLHRAPPYRPAFHGLGSGS